MARSGSRKNKRNRRKRLSKKKNWFAPFGFLFVMASLYFVPKYVKSYHLITTKTIKDLKVLGASAIPVLDIKKLSGLSVGTSASKQKIEKAAEKLRLHPRLSQVAIVRDMTGDVAIHIHERKPVALIQIGKNFHYVDETGLILDKVRSIQTYKQSMMVVTGRWTIKEADEKSYEAMRVRHELLEGGLKESQISELHYDASLGWMFYKVGFGAPIILGRGQYVQKIKRFFRVYKHFGSKLKSIEALDLDFDTQAVVKLGGKV